MKLHKGKKYIIKGMMT